MDPRIKKLIATNKAKGVNQVLLAKPRSLAKKNENKVRIPKSSSSEPDKIMECPICLETMTIPIIQCEAGHAMCKTCVFKLKVHKCPLCRAPMTDRRMLPLEHLVENLNKLKISCSYSDKGCKFALDMGDKEQHELECRYRKFICEGQKFGMWKCDWTGEYSDLEKHFKKCHPNHTNMDFKTRTCLKVGFKNDTKDIQLISFFNGHSYFYYKYKVDVRKHMIYWVIQYVGLKASARNYFYEFEISKGDTRKYKITEFCENDTVNDENIFLTENCVAMSFTKARHFLSLQRELFISFRIMTVKK